MKRRGLSTVVGAVFFVLVMASSIGYVTYSLDLIDDLARQVDVKQDTNQNRQNEEFIISKVSVDNNEFNLTVTNTGNIPINITRMWAKNMTDPSWNQTKYQINKFISSGGSVSDIGQGTGLVALDSKSYLLKLVTSRGNTVDTQLLSAASQPLEMTLFTTPPNPLSGANVTLLYAVKNNLTEGKIIQSLVPDFRPPTGSATAVLQGSVSPASVNSLKPGDTAFFEAMYLVTGTENQQVTFNATVANAEQGNYVTDTTTVDIAPVSEVAISSVLSGQVGTISMNYTTFEACDVEADNCESNSNKWVRAWDLTIDTFYIFRLNVTNNGDDDIILDEHTTLVLMPAFSGGSATAQIPYFIKADSTTTTEDSGAYTNYDKILNATGESEILYFGTKTVGTDPLEKLPSAPGIGGVFMIFFGFEDANGNRTVQPSDPAYSQNLPFQAFRFL